MAKEMESMKATFHILPNGEKASNYYQYVMKMEDFRKKAYLVVWGHVTQKLEVVPYSSNWRETAHIALTMAILGLELGDADFVIIVHAWYRLKSTAQIHCENLISRHYILC